MTAPTSDGLDVALVACLNDDGWRVGAIDAARQHVLHDLEAFTAELRSRGDEVLGMVAVDEDFFILVRVDGPRTRVLLSDVTAAGGWALARSVADDLGIPVPEDDDEPAPAGDLGIVSDLGFSAREMGALLDELLDDPDGYPDEALADIAHAVGFGPRFDELADLAAS